MLDEFKQFCSDLGKPGTIVNVGAEQFVSRDFQSFYREQGISCEISAFYTPELLLVCRGVC